MLCWNGEAWRIDSEPLVVGTNDTSQVLALLLKAVNSNGDVPGALQRLQGEFAIVFYDAIRGAVWYGRDWAGRRSLLKKTDSDGGIAIASVGGDGDGWVEVDAGGWWRLDVSTGAEEWVGSGMKVG